MGIRAHYLEVCSNPDETNQLNCEIERVIEDTFSMIIIVRNQSQTGIGSEIVWQVEKNQWQDLNSRQQNLLLRIPENKLLFLN
ncbi:MAG: hypothetical protein H6Q70_2654 [Firmicutes bacterium]|nr:hypothetical protein [Bacillota bacterium]